MVRRLTTLRYMRPVKRGRMQTSCRGHVSGFGDQQDEHVFFLVFCIEPVDVNLKYIIL